VYINISYAKILALLKEIITNRKQIIPQM